MCENNCITIDRSCWTIKGFTHWFRDWHSFRCVYKDGQKTYLMRYGYAHNLADIFGGTVVFDPPNG